MQGKIGRESAVYVLVNEHFEHDFYAAMRPSALCDTVGLMGGTVSTMFSIRFQRPMIISSHARIRMVEHDISEAMLLEVIDSGDARYKDATHL